MRDAARRATFDAVVLGSGIAGCATALALAHRGGKVVLATKGPLGESTTRYAQGGIAAALPGTGDRPVDHLADTLRAGADLCDPEATRVLVEGAAAAVEGVVELGARLDRGPDGRLLRSREGGHGVARVVHAGGAATGAELVRVFSAAVASGIVAVREGWLATNLVVAGGRCRGVEGVDATGQPERLLGGAVVLATGGAGQLFALTTNPAGATGDGLALALRAGLPVADVEFVQFHPTALAVEASPRPLLSEALRGEGALLVDGSGRRFVDELAPRDVVARAIAGRMTAEGADHVYLDARPVEAFAARFPSLAAALAEVGLDPASDLLPVGPAAHYLCGGILTDLDGATALPGCYAVGEVACTGVHGANRLASNSLLEGLVFGARAAGAIGAGSTGPSPTGALGPLLGTTGTSLPLRQINLDHGRPPSGPGPVAPGEPAGGGLAEGAVTAARDELARAMTTSAGVERDGAALAALAGQVAAVRARFPVDWHPDDRPAAELASLLEVARATVVAAAAREESRGAHFRRDHPGTEDAWRCRLAIVAGRAESDDGAPGDRDARGGDR